MSDTRVVVIGAHPDDEILGAGGTLARHVMAGDEVHAIVVADGASSRAPDEMMVTLEKDAARAAEDDRLRIHTTAVVARSAARHGARSST